MANQRKKTKVHIGGYYEKELKEELSRTAKAKGLSVSRVVEQLIKTNLVHFGQLN